jgi:hypothetical protein
MNKKQKAKWEKLRTKGMWYFVLLYGVLWWGGFMIIATSTYDYFFGYRGFQFEDLRRTVPIYVIGGLVFGLVMWLIGESGYTNSKDDL